MKALILGLASAALLTTLPVQTSHADGRHRVGSNLSIGIGYGYPYVYRPYPYYYPSYYYGFEIWPRYYPRRARSTRDSGVVRTQKLYVYPAAGQSSAQTAEDRYQCHLWAVESTDFDPTLGAGTAEEADAYGRAFTACMEGRDYVVK